MIESAKTQALTWYNAATTKNIQKFTVDTMRWGRANPKKLTGVVVLTGLAGITLYKLLFGKEKVTPSGTDT